MNLYPFIKGEEMQIAIVEDETVFYQQLKEEVENFFLLKHIEMLIQNYKNGASFYKEYKNGKTYDLIFMDIHLPDCDGIRLIEKIRQLNEAVPVIFVTSLENRAIDGYDVNAYSFIAKKNYKDRIPVVLNRLWEEFYHAQTIAITNHSSLTFLPLNQILWVESNQRNTIINTQETSYLEHESIQQFASKLPPRQFVEVYKSIFVNVSKVKCIHADTLELDNGKTLPVSRRNRKNVMFALMQRLSIQ